MPELLSELLKILQAETALYRRLLEVMGRERLALMRSHLSEIKCCAVGKRELIERLQVVEHQRTELVKRLAQHIGRPAGEVTLSLLARTSPEPHGTELRHVQTELLELVATVKEENQRNEVLCRHVGEMLRTAYGVLKGLAAKGFVYHRGGQLQDAQLNGKMVCNEI
jgi:flagellar biosynthesis/type III secretory pathway chaperone